MHTFFLILIQPKKVFKIIGNEYSDNLHRRSIVMFAIYGLIMFLSNFDIGIHSNTLFVLPFELILTIGFFVLVLWLISLLFYWMGAKLGGIADDNDIEATVAHALIPIISSSIILLFIYHTDLSNSEWNTIYLRNIIMTIGWLWALKIILQGIKIFHNFSLGKSLVTISPILLLKIGIIIFLW